jgi:hypothetical protein
MALLGVACVVVGTLPLSLRWLGEMVSTAVSRSRRGESSWSLKSKGWILMKTILARIVADSQVWGTPKSSRLTTWELTYPRFIHSELMTHRVFSRNAASSRAIPVQKMLDQVRDNPAMPTHWGKNQPGMGADVELSNQPFPGVVPGPCVPVSERECVIQEWLAARDDAILHVQRLLGFGLAKQVANRLLEPWQWMVTICTATEWDNFYAQRTDKAAQPEFKRLADQMLEVHNGRMPDDVPLGGWHLPFVTAEERTTFTLSQQVRCSTARCARVSYMNHDGTAPDPAKDTGLYQKLLEGMHMSPFEHQAQPKPGETHRNFVGWKSHRAMLGTDTVKDFPGLKKW